MTTNVRRMVDGACQLEPENQTSEVISFDWADVGPGGSFVPTYWRYGGGPEWFRSLAPANPECGHRPTRASLTVMQTANDGSNQTFT